MLSREELTAVEQCSQASGDGIVGSRTQVTQRPRMRTKPRSFPETERKEKEFPVCAGEDVLVRVPAGWALAVAAEGA